MSFSFSFSGDDIQDTEDEERVPTVANSAHTHQQHQQNSTAELASKASAFPVQGKPLLPALHHDLDSMLAKLPSQVAYSTLTVDLDGQGTITLPRRELWDVRVQLMAEEDHQDEDAPELEPGLGNHDVKTGIYEGGFKSWESSVDMVKVLASEGFSEALVKGPCRVIELGCGTGLPSLALFQWASEMVSAGQQVQLELVLADYNPTVLYLVTLPNLLISWATQHRDTRPLLQEALSSEGELEILPELRDAFKNFLSQSNISISFCSGAWSPEFVDLIYTSAAHPNPADDLQTLILGAETIYSPFALASFSDTVFAILEREKTQRPNGKAAALVAAKKLYFGVGGSLDDFVTGMTELGLIVDAIREEAEGVRRAVVRCVAS